MERIFTAITTFLILIILIGFCAIGIYLYFNTGSVTKDEFNKAITEVRTDIDSLSLQVEDVNLDVDTLKLNQDTLKAELRDVNKKIDKNQEELKAGMEIIYNENKKETSPTFKQRLTKFLRDGKF